jgi:hypothetical protein
MKVQPMTDILKRQLLMVFLSGFIYNTDLTLQYLQANNLTVQYLTDLFTLSHQFTNFYERKLFIFGLSSLLDAF